MKKYIYELRAKDTDVWLPFYVGQTGSLSSRISKHRSDAKMGSTLNVHNFIRQLVDANIEWDMFPVHEYTDKHDGNFENDHILSLLRQGYKLMNMKKGSPNWMKERQAIADDMNRRGLPKNTTEKQYRAILSQEELDRKHQKWLAEQESMAMLLAELHERERIEAKRKQAEEKRNLNMRLDGIISEMYADALYQILPDDIKKTLG